MLGHLMEWFYSGLGGIKSPENATAFKNIIIRPEVVGNITFADVNYLSPYGEIKNSWKKTGTAFTMNIHIPVNTNATIYLPAVKGNTITENGKPLMNRSDIKFIKFKDGKAVIEVGSGDYSFTVT